jgi:hypothetical protein
MNARRFWTSMGTSIEYERTEARDFTDLASNAVFLPDINSLCNPEVIAAGRLPEHHLRLFLHEAAHHVAFDSRVGNALAALWASCGGLVYETLSSRDEPKLPARDLAVFRTVHPLFNPLLEGTALLSEFDSIPGEMPVVSRVAQYGMLLFGKGRISNTTGDAFREYGEWLHAARQTDEWVRRKVELLSEGIDSPQQYLLGYLGLKGIHRFTRGVCPALRDMELFLLFMYDYWFGDAGMAARLLSPLDHNKPWESLGEQILQVAEYFQDRTDELYKHTNQYAKACCLHFAGGGRSAGISEEPCYRNAVVMPDHALEWHFGMRTAGTAINLAWPKIWKHRRVFRFSSSMAKVQVFEGGTASVTLLDGDSGDPIPIPAVPNCTAGMFEGSVESIVMSDGLTPLVCIFAGDGLVGVLNPATGQWNEPNHVREIDDCPSLLAVEGAMHAFSQRQLFDESSEVGKALEFYSKQSAEGSLDLWLQLAFHKVDRSGRNKILDALRGEGFARMVGTGEQMRDLARLSLACGGRKRPLSDVAKEVGMKTPELVRRIKEFNGIAQKHLNWWIFLEDSDQLECLV